MSTVRSLPLSGSSALPAAIEAEPPPLLSVLICTKDRPTDVVRAVRSVLRSRDVQVDLIVVDQSVGDDTKRGLTELMHDNRIRYVRSTSRGKGAALNEGLRVARSAIVACTDDDCEAPPEWAAGIRQGFVNRPRVAVVFSNVVASPYDRTLGYVPTYERRSDRTVRRVVASWPRVGLGAAMALRLDAMLKLGGFDETLGPGARFPAGEDWDIALRALLAGWQVYETTSVATVHHGFRTFLAGRPHVRGDWIALGAVAAKPLRAGYPLASLALIASQWVRAAIIPIVIDIVRGRRPSGWERVAGFVEGFCRAIWLPVEPLTMVFRTPLAPFKEGTGSNSPRRWRQKL